MTTNFRGLLSLALLVAALLLIPAAAFGGPIAIDDALAPAAWDRTIHYHHGQLVTFAGEEYREVQGLSFNKQPDCFRAYWLDVGPAPFGSGFLLSQASPAAPTPEPATLLTFAGAGLCMLARYRRPGTVH